MSGPALQHDHNHGHDHSHDHDHPHPGGPLGWLLAVFHLQGHEHDEPDFGSDPGVATSEGIRTVWIALAVLGVTTLLQVVIVVLSGSVALLADTVHNLGDTLNSLPLLAAFYLARRGANRRYTYGYGRAEDIAGVLIVVSIAFSAGYILWESVHKLLDPEPIERLPWVAAAAVIGFIGNETVAFYQIRSGKRIGSASLVADGLHARIDGLTSLVVLIAVGGSAVGLEIVDPIVGMVIGVAILFIARDAAKRVWYRLMDAAEPKIVDQIERVASETPGVHDVTETRVRWVGHELQAELMLQLDGTDPGVTLAAVRRSLIDDVRHLQRVTIETVYPGDRVPDNT